MKLHLTIIISICAWLSIRGQNFTFDQCQFAESINIDGGYCSDNGEFSNMNATPDPTFPNGCVSLQFANGVWFRFVPKNSAVLIRVFGTGAGGTMQNPKILLFDDCNTFLQCSPGKSISVDELVVDQLQIGKSYYIMVESAVGGEGSFKLCVEDFAPVPSPESDCDDAVILCDKSPFVVNALTGVGSVVNEIGSNVCIGEEFASSWYKWTCDMSGTLTFTLTPNNNEETITDDLDFAIYELPNGIDDCSNKQLVRCMASGANTSATGAVLPLSEWASCNGPTGLRAGETDTTEDPGCQGSSNNFIAPLDMVSGRSYVLIVNNFSRSGLGFNIEFGGTGTFLGPEADFDIEALDLFECDKTIKFTNQSSSATDPIVNITWNFGNGSTPSTATGDGSFDVLYTSFGEKIAAITVESSKGCLVTLVKEFYIEACCQDTSTLDLSADIFDVNCYQYDDGALLANGISGAPEYMFSINGGDFTNIPYFDELPPGSYDITIQDIKGCEFTRSYDIEEPPPITVDAGADQTDDLGCPIELSGSYESSKPVDSLFWSPRAGVDFPNELETTALPAGNTTYTLTVVDTSGCVGSDQVSITVDIDRLIESPNIFSPNGDATNELFFLSFGIADDNCLPPVESIEEFMVFDRWGSLVHLATNITDINGTSYAWDGKFNGTKAAKGVYVWKAKVKYLDQQVIEYVGDITLVR